MINIFYLQMKRREKDHLSVGGMKKNKLISGFTMAEMMIVVLIMGIITLVVLPALTSSLDHSRLKGAASEVANALQYAQLSAMDSGLQTQVIIAPNIDQIDVRQYKISANLSSGGNQLVAGNVESGTYELMEYPLKKGSDYQIQFPNENRFRGIDITASDFDQLNPVDFNTLGVPSHGGTATIVLGNHRMVVALDGLTGKISVSE